MSILCQKAEDLLKEKKINLSAEKRASLASYDEETQIRWIVNPLMEWMLQRITNQILSGPQTAVQTPIVTKIQQKTPNKVIQPITPVQPIEPVKVVEPVDDDNEPFGFGLFD